MHVLITRICIYVGVWAYGKLHNDIMPLPDDYLILHLRIVMEAHYAG